MELHPIDEMEGFEGIESLGLGEGDSIYFTPSGTPLRWEFLLENTFSCIEQPFREGTDSSEVKGRRTHKRMVEKPAKIQNQKFNFSGF